jgi:predicted  nucleic acid-binding Zn-ribbon protein
LLELHRLHQQLGDLRDRLDRGPKQIRARQANVAAAEEKLLKAQAEVKAARVASDQKQLQLKTGESKIVDLKGKLNACSTNREYQALKDQIAAAEMANSVLADEVLESMEKIDQLRAGIVEEERNLTRTKEEMLKVQQTIKSQEESLLADLHRVEGNLKQAEAALPDDFRDAYNRVVRSKGRDSMAPVEGESCGGCFQQLTPNMVNDLMLSRVVFCKICGRLLYLPEDRTPRGS